MLMTAGVAITSADAGTIECDELAIIPPDAELHFVYCTTCGTAEYSYERCGTPAIPGEMAYHSYSGGTCSIVEWRKRNVEGCYNCGWQNTSTSHGCYIVHSSCGLGRINVCPYNTIISPE